MLKRRTIIQKLMNQPGLVGCWIPEKHGGGSLNDLSGKNNHGTLNGPTWISENGIWILSYDGINDRTSFTNFKRSLTDLTIDLWIKPSDLSGHGANVSILEFGLNIQLRLVFTNASSPIIRARWRKSDGTYVYFDLTSPRIYGVWHNFLVTYNNNTLIGYVDGISDLTISSVDRFSNFNTLRVGLATAFDYMDGLIGIMRIFKRSLSAAEIYSNYELVRYYQNRS